MQDIRISVRVGIMLPFRWQHYAKRIDATW